MSFFNELLNLLYLDINKMSLFTPPPLVIFCLNNYRPYNADTVGGLLTTVELHLVSQ